MFWVVLAVVSLAVGAFIGLQHNALVAYRTAYLAFKDLAEHRGKCIEIQTRLIDSQVNLINHNKVCEDLSKRMITNGEKQIELLLFLLKINGIELKTTLTPDVPRYTHEDDTRVAFGINPNR
jgi:hypothetical protein